MYIYVDTRPLDEEKPTWVFEFIQLLWKDTPSRWPKTEEMKKMNEASLLEWKERRMVYNRRKQKVLLAMDLHQEYLEIPNRLEKERARIQKMYPKSYERKSNASIDLGRKVLWSGE